MKKILYLILISFPFVLSAQNGDLQLIQKFIGSAEYGRFISSSQFSSNGQVNLYTSNVVYQAHPDIEGKTVPVLNINFTQESGGQTRLVGQIQAIKVRDDYSRLPNNARYLMLYRDFRQYDVTIKTGTIKVFDLNYDEYMVGNGDLVNGIINAYDTYPMPPIIAQKYGLGPNRSGHYCDENKNGNVTFGECWRCLVSACAKNPECSLLCALGNLAPPGGLCNSAFILSCTWIAIWY